jgi:hypothetical protein
MSQFLLKSLGMILVIAFSLRATLLTIQYHFFSKPDFKFWELFFDHSPLSILKKIEWSDFTVFSLVIFTPIIEGMALSLAIFLAIKAKLPKLLIVALITIIAYFLHAPVGSLFYGFQGSVTFLALTTLYLYTMKLSSKSHTYAYCITTLAHAFYNFIGIYLVTLYTM